MNNNFYYKFFLILILSLSFFTAKAEESKNTNKHKYDFYAGIFDTIDKEGDEKANLYGIEHNNPILFRNTFVGKFSPISGGFITDKSSIYLYTGVQAEYGIGPLKFVPSFAPGYYEKGDGKDLGSALEFKSELKLAFDVLEGSQVGFSYSHISNNDWGEGGKNPGVNNKTISFSKSF
jgi:lipid A 3-O-deacylase|tara:strand:- start:142 stop:672 length:531 start_codon:yes stop_codon:yes gene_type:complete